MTVRATLTTLAACLLIAGCAAIRAPLSTSNAEPRDLVEYGVHLHRMDRAALNEALERAHDSWERDPSGPSRARLGLVRAEPGHTGHAPGAAVDDLASALSEDEGLDELDRAYLEFRMAQLKRQLDARDRSRNLRRENARLRKALQEAHEKLRALADIENRINTGETR